MTRPDRETKKVRRLTRLLAPFANRREFIWTLGAAGTALVTVEDLVAQVAAAKDVNDALRASYWVMWKAARVRPDDDPGSVINGHPKDLTDPLDGEGNTKHDPSDNDDSGGPTGGRLWVIWRSRANFENRFPYWSTEADYVLLNSARIGSYARALEGNGRISKGNLRRAFRAIKANPVTPPSDSSFSGGRGEIRDYWCY